MQARDARHVDNTAVLMVFAFDAEVRRRGADKSEWRPDVYFLYDVPGVVGESVQHLHGVHVNIGDAYIRRAGARRTRSYVKPADDKSAPTRHENGLQPTVVHNVIYLAVSFHRCADNLLWKVVGSDVAAHHNSIAARILDLSDYRLRLSLFKAAQSLGYVGQLGHGPGCLLADDYFGALFSKEEGSTPANALDALSEPISQSLRPEC